MIQEPRCYTCQLAVIGCGLAGFAASVFALRRGIATAQVGNTGAVAYTSGYLDLLGACGGDLLENPWRGLEALRATEPNHPLARIDADTLRTAFEQFAGALSSMGLQYSAPGEHNLFALTPAGTTKPTLCVPRTMLDGIEARRRNARTLVIGFLGLQGFSAKEVVANLKPSWPRISGDRLAFPDMESGAQVFPEVMARALEVAATRQRLAERIRAVLGDAEYVGLPAIMGVHLPDKVHAELAALVGVRLFEIPTMPPAIPGIRLREMFEQVFPANGLTLIPQQKVARLRLSESHANLYLRDSYGDVQINAQTAILATGRFLSGGLRADRGGVCETLLNIPVSQPESRADWHRPGYFDPRGHPINRAGIEVDGHQRPLDAHGRPISTRLFAAGALLAHQDWVRQRCGAGVAIAGAYQAVEAAARVCVETETVADGDSA